MKITPRGFSTMSNFTHKPIEKRPIGLPLPPFWHATHHYGIPYRPKDKPAQEDWRSVARKFAVDVKDLIFFNFLTNNPDEVNWYLSKYVGCTKISPSGNNWMFSNSANPGIIYIPPPEDRTIKFPAEEMCVWGPDQIKLFLQRLRFISQSIRGAKGERIQKLVQVILRVGYPRCLDLWYYNDMNLTEYCDWQTKGSKLRDMTEATKGMFPFDGASGLYDQSPGERGQGMWRIHAVRELFDRFACGPFSAAALQDNLEYIDELMFKGWYAMQSVAGRTVGVNAYNPAVGLFLRHVTSLTMDDNHLYAAFRP
jgi:hypothetical protein